MIKTTEEIHALLDSLRHTGRRIRLFYGDVETGKSWNEENDVIGTIGRSTAFKEADKILLLLANKRSMGGGGILEGSIVRITENGRDLYKHPNFHIGKAEARGGDVYINNRCFARFNRTEQATRFIAFLEGKRNSK